MITEEEKRALLDKTDVFVFDCDGVIWKGDSLIEGVPETLEMLKAMGKKMFFVTNNSTKSRAGYLKKFLSLGLKVSSAPASPLPHRVAPPPLNTSGMAQWPVDSLPGGGGWHEAMATSSTAPAHQPRGSANAETTPARAPAAAADRKQRPDATCEGEKG